jgi:ribosomal protein S18 acetylase RimI-like enzyme
VSKKAQGQGIGRSLLREASANIKKETGDENFYLYVLTDNDTAIGFYQRLGGKIIERETHPNPGGEGSSDVYKIAWEASVN